MKNKLDFKMMGVDESMLETMEELVKRRNAGEEIDEHQLEALEAIDVAGNIIDSLMSGRQVDLGYFKIFSKRLNLKAGGQKKAEQNRPKMLNNRKRKRQQEPKE